MGSSRSRPVGTLPCTNFRWRISVPATKALSGTNVLISGMAVKDTLTGFPGIRCSRGMFSPVPQTKAIKRPEDFSCTHHACSAGATQQLKCQACSLAASYFG